MKTPAPNILEIETENPAPGRAMALDLFGAPASENQLRTKPPHGARGRGMVWLDYETEEWRCAADDYRDQHGVELQAESRLGGRGNWFRMGG